MFNSRTIATYALCLGTASAAMAANKNIETGACCAPDADTGVLYCTEIIEEFCIDAGGYWYGPNTTCSDPFVECAPQVELGACCWEDADGLHCMELED